MKGKGWRPWQWGGYTLLQKMERGRGRYAKEYKHTSLSSALFMFGMDANLRDRRSRAGFSQ
jgi:hypothetical protein